MRAPGLATTSVNPQPRYGMSSKVDAAVAYLEPPSTAGKKRTSGRISNPASICTMRGGQLIAVSHQVKSAIRRSSHDSRTLRRGARIISTFMPGALRFQQRAAPGLWRDVARVPSAHRVLRPHDDWRHRGCRRCGYLSVRIRCKECQQVTCHGAGVAASWTTAWFPARRASSTWK